MHNLTLFPKKEPLGSICTGLDPYYGVEILKILEGDGIFLGVINVCIEIVMLQTNSPL